MVKNILKGILQKKLLIRKSANIQGTVQIFFPNPEIQNIILTDFQTVDIFKWIKVNEADIKQSNIEDLYKKGIIQIL
jgi:hypothetical protein